MKKILALVCVCGCFTQSVWAANNIDALQTLNQSSFNAFSEDLGAALSYKAVTPPTPLGLTGFDVGVEVTSTKMTSSKLWTGAISSGTELDSLIVPKLHLFKGLPFGIDIGAFYTAIPTTNIKLMGGELRYAIMDGSLALPAVGIRGSMTKLSGVDQLTFGTKSLDVSVSKGFLMFTPYAGLGSVWIDSSPNLNPAINLNNIKDTSSRQNKYFVGGNLNLMFMNLAVEFDKTGSAQSYSAKLGFRF